MTNRLKVIVLTVSCTILMLLVVSLFSPYNLLLKLSEDNIVKDAGIVSLFDGEEMKEVDYQGSNTYRIATNKNEYIAVKEYYSVMNYKWYVYEKIDEWE